MRILLYTPLILAALLAAAHFSRAGNPGLVLACLTAPGVLLLGRSWVPVVFRLLLLVGSGVWVHTGWVLVRERQAAAEPWGRLALILGGVALFTLLAGLVFRHRRLRERYDSYASASADRGLGVAAFLVAAVSLTVVQLVVDNPLVLLERFLPGGGWLMTLWLGVYAAWLAGKMLDPAVQPIWRRRVWLLFSVVFFGQLALGLLGID
ncbi:MAG: 4Fe-4S ferredoxin, partial [bacterium]